MVASTTPKSPTYHGNMDASSAWMKVAFARVPFLTIGKGGVLATGGKKIGVWSGIEEERRRS